MFSLQIYRQIRIIANKTNEIICLGDMYETNKIAEGYEKIRARLFTGSLF